MARPRPGLGHGLEALMPPNHQPLEPAPAPVPPPQRALERPIVRWEYALLERRRRRKRKRPDRLRIWFSHPDTSAVVRARPTILAARSMWAAMGLLGNEGWECIRIGRRRAHFKRPVSPREAD